MNVVDLVILMILVILLVMVNLKILDNLANLVSLVILVNHLVITWGVGYTNTPAFFAKNFLHQI